MIAALLAPDIGELLDQRLNQEARLALAELMDPEVADVLLELRPEQRAIAFRLLPRERAADVFTFLPQDVQEHLIGALSGEQLAQVVNDMPPDDQALLLDELPGQVVARMLAAMTPEVRQRTQAILGYPSESIGRIATPDYLTLRPEWTVQQAIEHIRRHGRDAETFDTMYVIDERGKLLDDIRLRQLLLADPVRTIHSLMDSQVVSLRAIDDREEAVRAMDRYDQPVLPVVGSDGVLVGIVTFDDVADVAEKEVTEDIQKLAGVAAFDAPYLTLPLAQLVRKRGIWLSMLFLGEMLTASAMSHYEHEIARAVVLTLFVPLIISSGGNSGSQASTLVIRALAVGEITLRDWGKVLRRELVCGLALGTCLAGFGVLRVVVWQWCGWADYSAHYLRVAITVAVTLVGIVLWGTFIGALLPLLLSRLRLDPATVSAPFVATMVDVTGLILYFSAALLVLRGTLL